MLTDIFSRRYEKRSLFSAVQQRETRLLVQAYRIINEQLLPYYTSEGKEDEQAKKTWTGIHDRLSMELGLNELSPRFYSHQTRWNGQPYTQTGQWGMNYVCEVYLTKAFSTEWDPDAFVKNRLSFVELAFREREEQIKQINANLPGALQVAALREFGRKPNALRIPGPTLEEQARTHNQRVNDAFQANVHELNTRFEQAGMPLNYHNGFIQITTDALTQKQIDEPFWALVKDPKWANVDTDMKEALDLRDSGGRDPALYAAKALESTIKIICDEKQWSHGKEKGPAQYLDHLESKANGSFIAQWERAMMQDFFGKVRNALGHGPGGEAMPALTEPQTDEAIELCMSWIKSLVKRL